MNAGNDTVVEKFALELRAENTHADFLMWQIVQRHVEADVVKIVWVCYVEPVEFNNKPFFGCAYQEQGYVACKHANQAGAADPSNWSHLLRCHRVVPFITHDAERVLTLEEKKEIGAMLEFTLGLDSITHQLESFEDMLMRMSLQDQRERPTIESVAASV